MAVIVRLKNGHKITTPVAGRGSPPSRGAGLPLPAQKLRSELERELALARQARAGAEAYRRQEEARARSDAQRLLLDTRLAIKREISALQAEASQQAKKLLVEIHMIRLAAQGEFEAQRQFTSAAKISALANARDDAGEAQEDESS